MLSLIRSGMPLAFPVRMHQVNATFIRKVHANPATLNLSMAWCIRCRDDTFLLATLQSSDQRLTKSMLPVSAASNLILLLPLF
jgi:hypothetical protein